ncbi:uncharacterized protein BX663DRAFT_438765 [Cokeromyces recurvatus]|uniref:uncharacterized protein n=1 Tax=Cokeromyces recurvatus TaxID=90255 RepID=UPI00221E79BC|nr:uncharacterized protein BX663DRAFT_438765 [Cokeromyces recurvatus]KAI7900774.1 hypothetical protein BX663DRAFT_438765 [Cokeromyces recurvatus]
MFKKPAAKESSYLTWLSTASQLSPPYDYFDFVNTFVESKKRVNLWYSNAMKKALTDAKGEEKHNITQRINEFNSRNTKISAFSKKYQQYWSNREESESLERIAKRQRIAAEAANEAACSTFEALINKVNFGRIE